MNEDGIILAGAKIKNFAGFEKFECKFDSGVTYLYGKNGAGKTTLGITGLQACIKGIAEQGDKYHAERYRCIGKNGTSADIEYEFIDTNNDLHFFIKNHITKQSNKITFRKADDSPIDDSWLTNFLNVSLMSAKNFCSLSGIEQAKILGIDTSSFDENIKKHKAEITFLNRQIKEIGKIEEVEKVEPVDLENLKKQKAKTANELNQKYLENRNHNKKTREEYEVSVRTYEADRGLFEKEQDRTLEKIETAYSALNTLVKEGYAGNEVKEWIDSLPKPQEWKKNPPLEPKYIEEMPNSEPVDDIDQKILDAQETNVKAKEYTDYLNKLKYIESREKKIDDWKKKVSEEEGAQAEYMKQHDFGFLGVTTDEDGRLLYNNRPINDSYYSKGELEIIVAKLAASTNPLFKTRFIDEFGVLDEENQEKIITYLLENNYQVIVAVPGENVSHDNALVLRECKLIDDKNDGKADLL